MDNRLHRKTEGQMICGVCNGIAEYSGNDVSVIRLLAVLAAMITGGTALLIYIVLAVILPKE